MHRSAARGRAGGVHAAGVKGVGRVWEWVWRGCGMQRSVQCIPAEPAWVWQLGLCELGCCIDYFPR